ncbi:MAG: radical SAM protein [Pseudonocardiaceae bacterium]
MWLEITGKCSLLCKHCYADSGPGGIRGTMDVADWCRVIEETARLGGRMVQFIGGEPTLHSALPDLIDYTLARGLQVEVFSNLVHVTPDLWKVFAQRGVHLATSYYSDIAWEHESITRGRGSYTRTRANIVEALRRSIPLRVGLIDVQDGQRVGQARVELTSLGVANIGVDRLRQVGRGARDQRLDDVSQLCGGCARGKVAVAGNGDVWPCVFARWMRVGNVHESALAEILAGPSMAETCSKLKHMATLKKDKKKCEPESKCHPAEDDCSPYCPPDYHSDPKKCWPYYYSDDK